MTLGLFSSSVESGEGIERPSALGEHAKRTTAQWNPVKELKVLFNQLNLICQNLQWNPVKELKVIRPGSDHFDLDNFVESGEGIERSTVSTWQLFPCTHYVESGEGIERRQAFISGARYGRSGGIR